MKTQGVTLLALLLSGCAHHLDIDSTQLASMSPQSAAYIENATYQDPPSWVPIGEGRLLEMRKDFAAHEHAVEDRMIAELGLGIEHETIEGISVLVITPKAVRPGNEDVIAFNVHGGAFFMGSARERSALLIAAKMGIRVYSVEYTLAPEAKFPVAIEQALTVYKNLATGNAPRRIVAVSTSAGGEIMLSMLDEAAKKGVPLPQAQVLFTPAADLSLTGDSKTSNAGRDILPATTSLRLIKEFYVGPGDLRDPRVSPLYGTFSSQYPPSIIVSGTRDLLLSDSVRLHWKLLRAGVESELLVGEGMWHGFSWEYKTPESVAALNEVVHFVDTQLARSSAAR